MSSWVYVSFLITLAVNCAARDLPSYFPKCFIDDPNLNHCILNASRTLKPQVIKGIKEIKLPSFLPLMVSSFSGSQERKNFKYNLTFTNVTVRGLDDYDFDEITYDPSTLTLKGQVRFNTTTYECDYEINGYLFYFRIAGQGFTEGKFGSVNGTFEVRGKLKTYMSREYYIPTSAKIRIKLNGYNVYYSGLFNNNQELAHLVNELLNINGQRIADAATPALEALVEGFLMKFVKTLAKLVPYNKLFPHS